MALTRVTFHGIIGRLSQLFVKARLEASSLGHQIPTFPTRLNQNAQTASGASTPLTKHTLGTLRYHPDHHVLPFLI
jgi:hypothetical protein